MATGPIEPADQLSQVVGQQLVRLHVHPQRDAVDVYHLLDLRDNIASHNAYHFFSAWDMNTAFESLLNVPSLSIVNKLEDWDVLRSTHLQMNFPMPSPALIMYSPWYTLVYVRILL